MYRQLSTRLFFLWLLACASVNTFAFADSGPSDVTCGIYLTRIYAVNLRENEFKVDFYLWFRWKDDELKPYETFEVVNGHVEDKTGLETKEINGYHYAVQRVTATIFKNWNTLRYPIDDHTLTIGVEDSNNESSAMRLIPDEANSVVAMDVVVPGWKVGHATNVVRDHAYPTNYGDISRTTGSTSTYSRYIFAVDITRVGWGGYFKLFSTIFISTMVAFVAFIIKPTDLDPRFGVGVGAIFATAASQFVVSSQLPETDILTLADALHILTLVFVASSLLVSTISLQLCHRGQDARSRQLDHTCAVLFPALYVASVMATTLWL